MPFVKVKIFWISGGPDTAVGSDGHGVAGAIGGGGSNAGVWRDEPWGEKKRKEKR